MIEISVGLLHGRKVRLLVIGHAGYADKGKDVVCAGISALVQALYFGFESVLKADGVESIIDGKKTRMTIDWQNCPSKEGDVLVETIVGSLKEIARVYPDHVRILEVHVDDMEF